jgi:deoxycytidylate deaminase
MIDRPDWDNYFLSLAFLVSARSRDQETKHGTVIVDRNNLILGTGYNSFIKGMNDASLPKIRPNKYPYMIHSELNAILNCKVLPREVSGGGKAYVTGRCCNHCLQSLIQSGVKEINMANRRGTMLEDEKTLEIFNQIVKETGVIVRSVDYDLKWIKQIAEYYESK